MTARRVVIVGGGVSGLVASYIFNRRPNTNVTVLEAGAVGGEFLAGGLKYIHHTEPVVQLFDELDLGHSNFIIQGGILLQGEVLPYPKCFGEMDKERSARIQADHYRKTRRAEPGADAKRAMNDPASTKPRQALRCHFPDMISVLASRAKVKKASAQSIEGDHVVIDTGEHIPYDFLAVTIPLWALKDMVNFFVPHGVAMKLNVAMVGAKRDSYARWDYVYTPYTPADCVHRMSPTGGGYAVEANGDLDKGKLESDLHFLFPDGWYMAGLKEGLKGHLLPLEAPAEWPSNIAPLGRFAKWDSRATLDVTLEDAEKLATRWLG